MRERLAAAIFRAVRSCGGAVPTTPRTLALLVAREAAARPEDVAAVAAALEHGVVAALQAGPAADRTALAARLAAESGLPPGQARWAVETWATALAALADGVEPVVRDVDALRRADSSVAAVEPFRRMAGAVGLVMMIGAMAGGLPACVVAAESAGSGGQAPRVRQLLARREPPGQLMPADTLTRWGVRLGIVGGMIGAGLGWMAGGFHDAGGRRVLGGALGAAWAFDGAAFGLAYGALIGTLYGAMAGAAVGVLVAGLLGRWGWAVGLKPAMWLFVDHF